MSNVEVKYSMKLNLFVTRIILFCLTPALAMAYPLDEIVITQQHYQVPVLLQKKDNPIVRIHLHNGSANNLQLTEMAFNAAGTTDWKEIKQISLYYAAADSGMRNLGSVE